MPRAELSELVGQLPQESYLAVMNEYLNEEKDGFYAGSLARGLAVSRREPWSEALTLAFFRSLVAQLRSVGSAGYASVRGLQEIWRRATPLAQVNALPRLKMELHAATGRPDRFGELAVHLLQSLNFRRLLYTA